MKRLKRKIHWPTKIISNKNYIKEVSIDGKVTNTFNFKTGYYDLYAAQIITAGNCITLLSSPPVFSLESFRNSNLFEDIAKYVFWTFNESYRLQLIEHLSNFSDVELQRCQNLLYNNFIPYDGIGEDNPDEELVWCMVKNNHLRVDPKFELMYQKDRENREAILKEINKLIKLLGTNKNETVSFDSLSEINKEPKKQPDFLDMLTPINGSIEITLSYIESKIIEARFPHNIFHTIEKSKKGANKTGLNSEIAAMVNIFQDNGYFKQEFTFKDIFKSFGVYTKNQAGKDYDYSFFVQDYNFKKYLEGLKFLKINNITSAS
ncbi:MAG: hypothetical protein M3Z26_11955 [Bacteroidota bacterium]|nr:hypothetical protein [Bacteroidota bacterium]